VAKLFSIMHCRALKLERIKRMNVGKVVRVVVISVA
jgi:hypothetical protein